MTAVPRVFADFHNADRHGRLRLNCRGTIEDLVRLGVTLREGLKLRLCMEDVEAEGTVTYSCDEALWVAVIDWKLICNNLDMPSRLPNEALVVRGGQDTPEIIAKSISVHPSGFKGVSVVSAAGKSIEELSADVPHSVVATTTVGRVRRTGGDVIPTAGKSRFHATLLIDDLAFSDVGTQTEANSIKRAVPRVFADFNNTTKTGNVRLNTAGANVDLDGQRIDLTEGMEIELYDQGEFVVTAIVVIDPEGGWTAQINWGDLERMIDTSA